MAQSYKIHLPIHHDNLVVHTIIEYAFSRNTHEKPFGPFFREESFDFSPDGDGWIDPWENVGLAKALAPYFVVLFFGTGFALSKSRIDYLLMQATGLSFVDEVVQVGETVV